MENKRLRGRPRNTTAASVNQKMGKILKSLRKQCGFRLVNVAAQCNFSHAYLSLIESGQRRATEDQLKSLAEIYGINNLGLQIMLQGGGYVEPLQAEIPVTQIRWAFGCILSDPNLVINPTPDFSRENLGLPLMAYIVEMYIRLTEIELLRPDERAATVRWLLGSDRADDESYGEESQRILNRHFGIFALETERVQFLRMTEMFTKAKVYKWEPTIDSSFDDFNCSQFMDEVTEEIDSN